MSDRTDAKPPRTKSGRVGKAEAETRFLTRLEQVLARAVAAGEITEGEASKVLSQAGTRRSSSRNTTRRAEILRVAADIFARKGYHAATLEEIGNRLGMTRPAFYHYFQSKQDLLDDICAEAVDEADKVVKSAIAGQHASLTDKLRDVLVSYATQVTQSSSTAIVMRNFEEMSLGQQQTLARRRRLREDSVRALVAKGVESGAFVCLSPTITTLTIFEAIQGIQSWYDPEGRLSVEEVCAATVDLFLAGLLARS